MIKSRTAVGNLAKDEVKSSVKTLLKEYKNVTAKEVFVETFKGDKIIVSGRSTNGVKIGGVGALDLRITEFRKENQYLR